jgi:hypothetical protein
MLVNPINYSNRFINFYKLIIHKCYYSTKTIDRHRFFNGIVNYTRADLARAITLIESSNQNKKKDAQLLMNQILAHLKVNQRKDPCLRLGFLFKFNFLN